MRRQSLAGVESRDMVFLQEQSSSLCYGKESNGATTDKVMGPETGSDPQVHAKLRLRMLPSPWPVLRTVWGLTEGLSHSF